VEEYVSFPEAKGGEAWTVAGPDLVAMVGACEHAASTEDARPILQGVYWHAGRGRSTMVATDGHRMGLLGLPSNGTEHSALVPLAGLRLGAKHFAGAEAVRVTRSGRYVHMCSEGVDLWLRLLEGEYPDYRRVIPVDGFKHTITIAKADLLDALALMLPIANAPDLLPRVVLSVDGDGPRLESSQRDRGSGSVPLDCEHDGGGDLRILFNPKYMRDAVSRTPGETVRLRIVGPERPILVESAEDQGEREVLQVVVPQRDLG
jgi:DNA polymerase-3 subunit beta